MLEPENIEKAGSVVQPGDFSTPHGLVFRRMLELFQAGKVVDPILVVDSMREHGELENVGGPVYVSGLTDGMPRGVNVSAYAERVRKSSDLRKARAAIIAAMSNASDSAAGPGEIIPNLIGQLEQIARFSPEPSPHKFEALAEDRYSLTIPDLGLTFEADRLRREHHELIGELAVRCRLRGIRSVHGVISIADFNLSSARARSERARLLSERSKVKDLDFAGPLEEFCRQLLAADRAGRPAVDLRELERLGADDSLRIEGLSIPRRHPSILFGDGGSAKSYLALYLAGQLAEQGLSVGLFDWELCDEDHRDRLERLFGLAMPKILYARCEMALVYETDRLKRIARENSLDYAVFDSVAFACDGPPESAEVAGAYFRAVRQIGVGSLHVAHITKGENAEQKPFGSVFWHNGARCTWFAKLAEEPQSGNILQIGLFNRKVNLGPLYPATGFKIEFTEDRTFFTRADPADTPDLAPK